MKQGCLCVHPSDMFVTSKCPSNKSDIRPICINPELLCPRWLPHGCHIGWLDASFHYIQGVGACMGQDRRTHVKKGANWKKVHIGSQGVHTRLGGACMDL
jgi:hypothetical protein